jgi:hypothetical protein
MASGVSFYRFLPLSVELINILKCAGSIHAGYLSNRWNDDYRIYGNKQLFLLIHTELSYNHGVVESVQCTFYTLPHCWGPFCYVVQTIGDLWSNSSTHAFGDQFKGLYITIPTPRFVSFQKLLFHGWLLYVWVWS